MPMASGSETAGLLSSAWPLAEIIAGFLGRGSEGRGLLSSA